jgi:hypothetical protein
MRLRPTLILIASAVAVQASAQPATPARKPGLWKQTIASTQGGKAQPPVSSTICLDASVDKALSVFSQNMERGACSANKVDRTPTGYRFASTCKFAGAGTVVTNGTASGDFNSSYKVAMNSVISGASMAAMNGASSTTITAVWAGACPAGTKPGDMTMPGGIKINMMAAMARAPR